MESLQEQTWEQPNFPAQEGERNTDVRIIGGGMADIWNSIEHTWDFPYHGSRFTEDGKLNDNPAPGNLKKLR